MAKVICRNKALDDLDRIFHCTATHDDQAARRVAERLIACGESLRASSHHGRPATDGRREMTPVPPYILRPDVDGETVLPRSFRRGARLPDQTS